jgi:hypothetical protein
MVGATRYAAADTLTLEWNPSTTPSVGYKVHVGTASGAYTQHFDVGSATLFSFGTAVAGQRYCFAVSAYLLSSRLDGPNSAEVCGYSNAPPTLQNPGSRTSTVGQPTSLQLVGSDPQSQPLTYSASGLPPGLSVMASTGFISGTGTTAGTYNVTVRASDGTLTASQQFTWVMRAGTGGADTTPPVATITAPTSNSSYTSTAATINLGGTATDNVGVTQVRWSNDRGGNGTATGTATWNVTGIPLQNGSNVITITAVDAAGNSGVDSLTVAYAAPTTPTDTTRPTIAIVTPTTGTLYSTTKSSVSLTGTAADNVRVAQVRWSNDRGGSGTASGTTSWSAANIPLQSGTNAITVTAVDASGNTGTDRLTVTYTPPTTPPPSGTVTLSARMISGDGWFGTALTWTSVSWSSVDVYRNGARITNTANDRSYNDRVWNYGTYAYKICARNSTTACSNTVSVTLGGSTTPSESDTVTLNARKISGDGWFGAELKWSAVSWPSVDVYRDGARITNTPNDRVYNNRLWQRGTYTYRICAPNSTSVCSNSVTVTF